MESKKMNKKFNSILWAVIYSLPLIVLLVSLIGYLLIFKETGVLDPVNTVSLFDSAIVHTNDVFSPFNWSFIEDVLSDTLVAVGFDLTSNISSFVILLFTWIIQLSFIHVLIDFILFIPRALHNLMERWS